MPETAPHTPRPFVYHPGGYGRYHPEDDGQYHGFLSIPESNTTVTVYADTIDELNAVCSLIAAAPYLLAALQQMRRLFNPYYPTDKQAAAINAADAAIAKATGNSQDARHAAQVVHPVADAAAEAAKSAVEAAFASPAPAPGTDATTADGRFVSGPGYGGERM